MRRASTTLLAITVLVWLPAMAQEQAPERPWSDTAELSIVTTTGNAENVNLALGNKFVYTWGKTADLTVDAGALRTETTTFLYDVDPDDTGRAIVSDKTSAVTAERYYADGKYRRTIREGFLWYAGAGWERNEFAGIDARWYGSGGLGYRFFENERHGLVGEFGVTYTDESYTDPTPAGATGASFAGARGFLGYHRALSASAKLTSDLELLDSLDDTSDLRANWLTSVTASLTEKLALKVSYNVLYDAQPAFRKVAVPPASNPAGTATFELDEIDTILSASLVINF